MKEIVIARKLTGFEFDQRINALSSAEQMEKYNQDGVDGEHIYASHLRQLAAAQKVITSLDNPPVIVGDGIEKDQIKAAGLVVAIGGDNYLQHVSHYLDQQPIVGINSDPLTSVGAFTHFDADSFERFLPDLKAGNYELEEYLRLQALINNQPVWPLAVSEMFVGTEKTRGMSKYILRAKEQEQPISSSGLLVATGYGTTGWYLNANSSLVEDESGALKIVRAKTYPKTSQEAYFTSINPMVDKLKDLTLLRNKLQKGETLELTWTAHFPGEVSPDSQFDYPIKRGDRVTIQIAEQTLNVVKPINLKGGE